MRGGWGRLAEVLAGVALIALTAYESHRNPAPWELLAGLVTITVAVATIRRAPLLALGAATASGLAMVFDYGGRVPLWPVGLMVLTSFLAGRRLDRVGPALAVFGGVVVVGLPVTLLAGGGTDWAALVGYVSFAAALPWQLGRYVRLREELARTGWERAEQYEVQQRMIAGEARLRERARIAGDMHDSLGHELSLIALRAGALEVAPDLDERYRGAAAELRRSAAAATERLHDIIGVLREADDAAPTDPADGAVGDLVGRAAASGLVVRLDGELPGRAPAMVRRAAYRVVQEALTNAAKHAPGAAVTVTLAGDDDETVVTVDNPPPPAGPLPGAGGGRRGLIGLRERVRLLGGTFEAGPADGGFRVLARLPHAAAPAEEEPSEPSRSAAERADVQRRARRTLAVMVAVPVAALGVLTGVSVVAYTYDYVTTRLDPAQFDRLRPGQPRAELAPVLPDRQQRYRPRDVAPVPPPGAVCEYYGTGAGLFEFSEFSYRLCFLDGRLVSRDHIDGRRDTQG
ncbi:sensor histidine kinase [Amycolatopsis suaedae]|nr:histidine kinase [Amycolatopsis suaedae]